MPLAMVSIDQLKAFDRVSHDFLHKTLQRFGFGPIFRHWISTIYNNSTSSIEVNGWLTKFINMERGLRQGCALSIPLYILTAEILEIHIRNNTNIHGITLSKHEVKLSQYADDTTLFLRDDQSVFESFKPSPSTNMLRVQKSTLKNAKAFGAVHSKYNQRISSTFIGTTHIYLIKF